MSNDRDFLLRLMSDHLHRRSTPPEESIDWKVVADLAKSHDVAGIVYQQCKAWMPETWKKQFEQTFSFSLFVYANRIRTLKDIQGTFAAHQIETITIKGLEVARLYPIPALRTMGDLDILVHQRDKEAAGRLLDQMGFETNMKNPNYDWVYMRDGTEYELHHQLFYVYDKDINDPAQVKFFNNFWPYVKDGQLDWSFHFLYMLVHLKKHLMLYGAGFRMFLDFAVILKSDITLDWPWIEQKLDDFGLRSFADTCFALIERWFGVKTPIPYVQLDDELAEKLTERVALNGVFGFSNKENSANVEINALMKAGDQHFFPRLRVLLHNAFPAYSHIAYVPEYSFIEGKPWLLPVAWIYRFYRLATGKTPKASTIMDGVMISEEKVSRRKAELQDWGL